MERLKNLFSSTQSRSLAVEHDLDEVMELSSDDMEPTNNTVSYLHYTQQASTNSNNSSSALATFGSSLLSSISIGSPKLDFLNRRRKVKAVRRGMSSDSCSSSDSECNSPYLTHFTFSTTTQSEAEIDTQLDLATTQTTAPDALSEFTMFPDLPIELRVYPLQWMSIPELRNASLVCKDWHCAIQRSRKLWKGKFHLIKTINAPPVRVCHGALVHKESLIVYGGHVPSDQGDYITSVRADLWEYNIGTHEWRKLSGFEPLTETMPILYNDKMYVFGGFINSWRTSTIVEYDFNSRKYSKVSVDEQMAPPKGRSTYSAVLYNSCVYIYGGWDGHESMNDLHCFNLESKQWIQIEQPIDQDAVAPCVRSHAAWVYKDAMYIWGGYGQHGHPTDLCKYHFATNRWSKVPTKGQPPCGRSRMRAVPYGNRTFILGGWDRKQLLGDFYELNLDSGAWKKMKHTGLPNGISQYSMGVYNNVLIVFGGCCDGESSSNLFGFKIFDNAA